MTSRLEKARPIHARYMNGLERTGVGVPELFLLGSLRARGVRTKHAQVPWHDEGITFPELLKNETEQAEQDLNNYGRLALIGVSAGGSLALNVISELLKRNPDADVYGISISAWLRTGDLAKLEQVALHREGKKPSQAFMESVLHCDTVTLPSLDETARQRLVTVIPEGDNVVPIERMGIGVSKLIVPRQTHMTGIIDGVLHVPGIIDGIHDRIN